MSKFFEMADKIRNVLVALPEMHGTAVLVDRQKDLSSEFKKSMAKISGCVVIEWTGGNNTDPDGNLQIDSGYNIAVISKPIISKGFPCDVIIQAIMKALHGWNPSPTEHSDYEARVDGPTPIPSPSYLIFQITLKSRINL